MRLIAKVLDTSISRMSRADDWAAKLLTRDEARRIAADIAEPTRLTRKVLRLDCRLYFIRGGKLYRCPALTTGPSADYSVVRNPGDWFFEATRPCDDYRPPQKIFPRFLPRFDTAISRRVPPDPDGG